MQITVGSFRHGTRLVVFTLTPIIAESEPQPNVAHPEVQMVPLAADSEMLTEC